MTTALLVPRVRRTQRRESLRRTIAAASTETATTSADIVIGFLVRANGLTAFALTSPSSRSTGLRLAIVNASDSFNRTLSTLGALATVERTFRRSFC